MRCEECRGKIGGVKCPQSTEAAFSSDGGPNADAQWLVEVEEREEKESSGATNV